MNFCSLEVHKLITLTSCVPQTCLELERYLQSEPYVSTSDLKFDGQDDLWSKLILACGDKAKGDPDPKIDPNGPAR